MSSYFFHLYIRECSHECSGSFGCNYENNVHRVRRHQTQQYAVVSAGVSADAVYSGQIASVTSNTISFESSSDSSEVTVNPFVSGVFNSSVRSPILTSALSGAGVGSIPITYAGTGFSTAPEIDN